MSFPVASLGRPSRFTRALGPGFLESVYESALAIELEHRGISFTRQVPVELGYRGQRVGEGRIDLIVERSIVAELKAVENLIPLYDQQVLSYLKVTGLKLGLLINFKVAVLTHGVRRVLHSASP